MPHTPRFGIQTGPHYVTWSELVEYWQAADSLGLQSAFTFDHFLPIAPGGTLGRNWVEDTCLEGWTTLTALGALTKQIIVGCLVTGNTYRHPAVLANMAATVDHITNGRHIVGMGAAWYELEHRMYGIPFYTVGERLRRLNEAVQVMKLLWTQKRSNFEGTYYQLSDALSEPKPIQHPHPPLLIGGGGEKVTLRIVANHADIWHGWGGPAEFARKIGILRGYCDSIGRNVDEIEISTGGPLIMGRDHAQVEAQIAAMAATRKVSPEQLKQMVFAGTPDEVAARIQSYLDVGVTHILFTGGPYTTERLEVFASEVMPRFRPVH